MTPAIKWLERGFDVTQRKIQKEAIEVEAEYGERIRVYPDSKTSWYTERFCPIGHGNHGLFTIKPDDELGERGLTP